jgi:hypothetical protein
MYVLISIIALLSCSSFKREYRLILFDFICLLPSPILEGSFLFLFFGVSPVWKLANPSWRGKTSRSGRKSLSLHVADQRHTCFRHDFSDWSSLSLPIGSPLHYCTLLLPIVPYCSLLFPIAPYCSLLLPISPYFSLFLPISPYCSLLLPIAPYCSLLLPIAPYCYLLLIFREIPGNGACLYFIGSRSAEPLIF